MKCTFFLKLGEIPLLDSFILRQNNTQLGTGKGKHQVYRKSNSQN